MTSPGPASRAAITTGVPAGANRSALSTRLSTASRMRSGSISAMSLAGASTLSVTPASRPRAAACSALRVSSALMLADSRRG